MSAPSGTFLGFDFGTRRIGVAVGQALTRTARPLLTLRADDGRPDWSEVDRLIAEWRPAALVVGLPLNMDETEHAVTERARRFGNQLRGRYNLPVHLIDERLSSLEAERYLRDSDLPKHKRQDKAFIDQVAAQLILESWLANSEPELLSSAAMPDRLDVEPLLAKLAGDLQAELSRRRIDDPLLVGIHTGGVWIAEALRERLRLPRPIGTLSITFYRDDFTRIGLHPQVQPSQLPPSVDDMHIVLVDDVLHTGRTVRAALNEIFDYGRPASVLLAVLVDRGGRELPFEATVAGARLELAPGQNLKLTGPDPLRLSTQESP